MNGHDEPPADALTTAEIATIINANLAPGEIPPERRSSDRHEYSCLRAVADWQRDAAKPYSFYPVRCRDISTRGIGFCAPKRPASDAVVIRLSADGEKPLLIAGKVVHCEERSGDPAFPFVVGCTFTKRL